MNFNSQICTTRSQSEALLKLGLKKETADMYYFYDTICAKPYFKVEEFMNGCEPEDVFPAWSLGRLIEMFPSLISISKDLPTFHHYAYLDLSPVAVSYDWEDYDGTDRQLVGFYGNGLFAAVVDAIEWLIKEGYFNKEYLV